MSARGNARETALLRELIRIYDRLTTTVLTGSDARGITSCFGELVRRPVALLDPTFTAVASAGIHDGDAATLGAADPPTRDILRTAGAERSPLRLPAIPGWSAGPSVVAPVVAGEEILGYLVILERDETAERSELHLLSARHAATVCAVAILRERSVSDVANDLRGDLISGLLVPSRDPAEAAQRAKLLHLEPGRPCRVLVVIPVTAPDGGSPSALALRRRVLAAALEQVEADCPGTIGVSRASEVVAFLPDPAGGAAPTDRGGRSLDAAFARVSRLYPDVLLAAALGGEWTDPSSIPASYVQARRAAAAAARFRRVGVVTTFADLGVYGLLFQVPDDAELRAYAERVLGRLLEYDRKHQAGLLHTLRVHIAAGGSLQAAARELVVHANTVGYRLQRIQQITGLDLSNADDRLDAQLALKIVDGLSPDR